MIFYDQWFRKHGLRRQTQLMAPMLSDIKTLELPRSAIYHYIGSSSLEAGPAGDEYIFRNITRPIKMRHITDLAEHRGNPRRVAVLIDQAVRAYHIKNRRYQLARTLEQGLRDPQSPLVVNYALLHRQYRYVRSIYTENNRWWNINATVYSTIAATVAQSDRQEFLLCRLPKILPGLSILRIAEQTTNQVTAKVFNNPESMFLLEMWKWCGENRELSQLNMILPEFYNRVNFIFEESGRWFVINLGIFNSWRGPSKAEMEANPDLSADTRLTPYQFQRRFLRLMMTLYQVRTDAATLSLPDVEDDGIENPENPQVISMITPLPVVDPLTGHAVTGTDSTEMPETVSISNTGIDQQFDSKLELTEKEIDDQIEKELEDLDRLNMSQISQHNEIEDRSIAAVEEQTLESGVTKVCDRLAEDGLISANELKRYERLAKSHETIVAPDGITRLTDFIKVSPEMVKIDKPAEIPDVHAVVDKSMLKSTLIDFDSKYIKHVMDRDIASMVMSAQNAGICITGYKVEKIEDAINSYKAIDITVAPVEGQNGTWRIKLPHMEEDGTWTANGIKYRMRKQAGELPIRKIAPNKVSLTSYYGKVFVGRSDKRVNDYGTWLCNAIMARGLDNEDTTVTQMYPSDVFDNLFVCPRLYSTLARSFRGFTLGGFEWTFDHRERKEIFGEAAMVQYEVDGSLLCGLDDHGTYLVMDKNNAIYKAHNGVLSDFMSMEDLLGLNIEKAPVEFAEMRVMGKTIPLGVILGYEIGLDRLMRLLNVEPRRINAGQRMNLAPHEYPIVFRDETLIFSRDDRLASLFLAGFGEYHRELRKYSVYDFDRRGVYLNILENIGRADRYLREIDLMYQMFIDPITKEILIEMGEPTDFRGLLFRSAELLLTDYHPASADPAYRRLKGYERMAGAVYAEMIRSIRSHNGRAGKSRHQIDLKPFAVWKNISSDPSISLVNDINPIENLKQAEAVTTGGTGGRSSRSMTKITREYNKNDMGTISELTVDSGDVGINTQTSANPLFTSLRGTSSRYDLKTSGATSLLSTSALISPAADMDD